MHEFIAGVFVSDLIMLLQVRVKILRFWIYIVDVAFEYEMKW